MWLWANRFVSVGLCFIICPVDSTVTGMCSHGVGRKTHGVVEEENIRTPFVLLKFLIMCVFLQGTLSISIVVLSIVYK